MSASKPSTPAAWVDPDDAPELDAHFFDNAEVAIGERVIRPATDTMAKRGRGRPPKGSAAKVQQTLKLSPEVLEHFRATGDGWQGRIDDVLRQHVASQRAVNADGDGVSPALLTEAADFLRAKENGGWFVAPTGRGDWWLGDSYASPGFIIAFASARGFDMLARRSMLREPAKGPPMFHGGGKAVAKSSHLIGRNANASTGRFGAAGATDARKGSGQKRSA